MMSPFRRDMALKVPHVEGSVSSSPLSEHHELKACSESFETISQHETFSLVKLIVLGILVQRQRANSHGFLYASI